MLARRPERGRRRVQSGLVLQKENSRIRRTVNVTSGQKAKSEKRGNKTVWKFFRAEIMLPATAELKQVHKVPVKIAVNSFQLKCRKLKLNKASYHIKIEQKISPSLIKLNRKSGEVSKFIETLNTMFYWDECENTKRKNYSPALFLFPFCLPVSFLNARLAIQLSTSNRIRVEFEVNLKKCIPEVRCQSNLCFSADCCTESCLVYSSIQVSFSQQVCGAGGEGKGEWREGSGIAGKFHETLRAPTWSIASAFDRIKMCQAEQ